MTKPKFTCIALFLTVSLIFSNGSSFGHVAANCRITKLDTTMPSQSIFLVGSAGTRHADSLGTGTLLRQKIAESGKNSTLLLLGNNSLKVNFSDTVTGRKAERLIRQIKDRYEFFKNMPAEVFAVPGNLDWANGTKKGMDNVQNYEYYIEHKLDLGDIIKPDHGCPGPEEYNLGDDVVLLLIDTQWFLQDWQKPGEEEGCDVQDENDFLLNLDDAIKRNYNKKIIVAGHHDLLSNGPRGGFFSLKTHLFPLTLANKNCYVPLPGVGSIYVWYRQLLGEYQDESSPRYRHFRHALQKVFGQHDNLIYVSAHEHSLEYHKTGNQHYVVSGAFSSTSATKKRKAAFVSSDPGFAQIDVYPSGEVWLSFWTVENQQSKLAYRQKLFESKTEQEPMPDQSSKIDYSDSTITISASKRYIKKGKRPGMLGNNYRAEWKTPVRSVPYFDIGREKGGLKIVKRGGGMQTKSLRLEDSLGRQWVLRSIDKYPENAIPEELRGTIAAEVVRDQISASNPYGAFVVPSMAEAAGIYHTNPKLVYLPDDPRLGIYREEFGNALYLFEERPDEDHKNQDSFGDSEKIISTPSVLDEIRETGHHRIDQEFTLRSRLFDMLIGDWDRHDDQWRWARFGGKDDFTYYRPIPRDRDQTFFWSDGWLLDVGTHKWGVPKFQGFHANIRDINTFNFNARYFDRSFLNELSLEDWIKISKSLQAAMTDEVIEQAIHQFPKEIFALHGQEIIQKMKSRRDKLPEYAVKYYLFLAKDVNITGTDKNDLFEVERLNNDETRVTVYQTKEKSGDIKFKYYDRTFKTNETQEIRLYGLDDNDRFHITGHVDRGIKVRIIGGDSHDIIDDESEVFGPSHKTVVYDTRKKTTLTKSKETLDKTTDHNPLINQYNRQEFQYDLTLPLVYATYNPDDGIFLGVGTIITKHGFRKYPFKSRHTIRAELAPKSRSYGLFYKGIFTDAIGKWDFIINANIYAPSYTDYFYGYGNETTIDQEKFDDDHRYYSTRYLQYILYPEIQWKSRNVEHTITVGGGYQTVNIKKSLNEFYENEERYIFEYAAELPYELLDVRKHYLGLYTNYKYDNTKNELYPQGGFRVNLGVLGLKDIDRQEKEIHYAQLRSNLAYYYTFGNSLRSTLALRAGGAMNFGSYEFYQAPSLGGNINFRGVRKDRLTGEKIFFQNTDLRIRLFSFHSPIVPGDFGITLFHDVGRVWVDNDPSASDGHSEVWHRAMGTGIWLAPLGKAALALDYSWSTLDESAVYLRLGFLF